MRRFSLSALFLTLLLTGCGLSDRDRRFYEIEQKFIDKSIEVYKEGADKEYARTLKYKKEGNKLGVITSGNQAQKYNLEMMKLLRFKTCLNGKLSQEVKFERGHRACVAETGTDPNKPPLLY